MSLVLGKTRLGEGQRLRGLSLGLAVLVAVAACALIDLGLLGWIRIGPPAGKGDLFFLELVVLIAAALTVAAAALLAPNVFRAALPIGWAMLAWHTGFQVPLSSNQAFVISVFDVLVPLVLFLGIIGEWYRSDLGVMTWADQHKRLLILFWAFCVWGLCLAIVRDVNVQPMLANLKSYLFYPLIAIMAPWCIRSFKQLYAAVGVMLALIFERALDGLYQFATHHTQFTTRLANGTVVSRIDGNMADTNQFAMYIMSGILITAAIVVAGRSKRLRLALLIPLVMTTTALFLTFTRGAWLGLGVGVVVMTMVLRPKRTLPLVPVLLLAGLAVQFIHPGALTDFLVRATEKNDTIVAREQLYSLGFTVIQHYPFGAGWGAYFQPVPGGLATSNLFPWYHDDYVQLATEIGVAGLLSFLALVGSMFLYAYRAYKPNAVGPEGALLAGLMAAFAGILAQAGTDQFIWHADIAPHIWIVAGMMLSAATLLYHRAGHTTTSRAEVVRRLRSMPPDPDPIPVGAGFG